MPWIRGLRILPGLWIAWTENDYHEMNFKSLGFTSRHAHDRVFKKMEKDE